METSLSFLCLYYTIYLNNVNTNYKNNLNFIFAKALAIEFDSCYNYKYESAYPRLKDGRGLFFQPFPAAPDHVLRTPSHIFIIFTSSAVLANRTALLFREGLFAAVKGKVYYGVSCAVPAHGTGDHFSLPRR